MTLFIEINDLKKAKNFLRLKYDLRTNDEQSSLKYHHLLDCLNILKYYGVYNYIKYGQAVLLHDIGRFFESDLDASNFNHAYYGYELIKKEYTKNPIILLPIKYHEDDLKWKLLLLDDPEYISCSKRKKKQIIKCSKLVRDIDIISNMKSLIGTKSVDVNIKKINMHICDKLRNGEIGTKDDIYNQYDKISYILCGLNLLTYKKSFCYIKKHMIVEQLINKQLNMVSNNNQLYDYTNSMHEYIKKKYGV